MTAVADQSSDLPGLTVLFRPGDDDRVEQAVAALKRLGIRRLRVPLAATAASPDHDDAEWIGTLLPRLATEFDLLACLPADAPDALIDMAGRQSGILGGIEIASAGKTAAALQLAAHFKSLGFLTVVSGIDVTALGPIAPGGGLDAADVLGITAHHGTGGAFREDWSETVSAYAQALEIHGAKKRLWVTETASRHGGMTSGARFGHSSAPPRRRPSASTGRLSRISTRSNTAPTASMRTSATTSTDSSGRTARPSCWAVSWNRAASAPSARLTGSSAPCR